jgi:hypothetical protein
MTVATKNEIIASNDDLTTADLDCMSPQNSAVAIYELAAENGVHTWTI